jgi:predicted chitinase
VVEAGRLRLALFLAVATQSEYAHQAAGQLILAQDVVHSAQVLARRFAARLLIAPYARRFGFHHAKLSKFA